MSSDDNRNGESGSPSSDAIDAALVSARSGWARPANVLDGEAAGAWEAYNAMQTTKQRHYDLLQIIDNKKKKFNIDATEKDIALLANLLEDHDAQVKRFTAASTSLKQTNPDAHRAVFEYIGIINQAESDTSPH